MTDDIQRILSRDRRTAPCFKGVYAKDELPDASSTSSLYVCNTDPSTRQGEHWVVIYIGPKRQGEYFDSFGRLREVDREFVEFLDDNCSSWTRNVKTVQHMFSDACGYHCVFYSVYRCLGFNVNSIVNMYTNNLLYNDAIVKSFVRDRVLL